MSQNKSTANNIILIKTFCNDPVLLKMAGFSLHFYEESSMH